MSTSIVEVFKQLSDVDRHEGDSDCDGVHGGDLVCLQAAIEFITKCGCITHARKILDVLEKSRAEINASM